MPDLEDTRPRSPFKDHPPTAQPAPFADNLAQQGQKPPLNAAQTPPPEYRETHSASGPGCLVWGLLLLFGGVMSLAIVGLAATAGWTSGEREANRLATATQASLVEAQLIRIPEDIAQGNAFNLNRRLNYLETVVPSYGDLPMLRETATALYLVSQPTATETPTATLPPTQTSTLTLTPQTEVTQAVEQVDATSPTTAVTSTDSRFDLVALLQEAREEIAAANYEAAYETLDIIIRVDEDFQRETVQRLMYEALTARAAVLFRSPQTLAEAITLTDLAEEYGPIAQSDLNYERLIASLYLDAQRSIGSGDHPAAIQAIQQLLGYQSSYQGEDFNRLLFNEYVAYAAAWEAGLEYCPAVTQYQNALNLFNDQSIIARRDNAQQLCALGTSLTLTPGVPGAAESPIAPVGQPGG